MSPQEVMLHLCLTGFYLRKPVKKEKTCGSLVLIGKQKLHKKILSVSHHFGVNSELRGNFDIANSRSSSDNIQINLSTGMKQKDIVLYR